MQKLRIQVFIVLLVLAISLNIIAVTPVSASVSAFQDGGDRLVALQNNDGGWDWPLDDFDPNSPSPTNTIGPIGMGLAQAYLITKDDSHVAALEDAKLFLLAKTNNFSPSDGYLAVVLDDILGETTCKDHVTDNFYDQLAAGTYGPYSYDTAGYVQSIRDSRTGNNANLAAWDIGMGLVSAAMIGANTEAWIDGVKDEINELDGDQYYDVIGLAGAVYGLAYVNEDFDPTAGEHEAAGSLRDLADILVGYQLATGGFTWNSNYLGKSKGRGNETVQETAYAVLALYEMGGYAAQISVAKQYLRSVQLETGGWENYTDSGENNEVTGEALWALSEYAYGLKQ